ncbi:MAG: AraC family transcriptional regulator [Holophaga sp.]|nr:AraC family transcriptional regulator [Holophaga sp.]
MLDQLIDEVRRFTDGQAGESPFATAIPGLTILRSNHEKRPHHLIFKPALCIVLQGAKWALFGEKRMDYRAGQALVVSVEMPAFGTVAEASPREPYLGIIIEFDLAVMREVFDGLEPPPRAHAGDLEGSVFVTDFAGPMTDCTLRAVRLLATPQAIPVLYPAIMREICYWLLTGPHGGEVAKVALGSNHEPGVIHAIHALRDRFAQPVRIDALASIAKMSPSAFHRHFKRLTSMTPLQYQKQLRLIEARRMMVSEAVTVEAAAYRVGYESPSQFSREYARMFGMSPKRDGKQAKGPLVP